MKKNKRNLILFGIFMLIISCHFVLAETINYNNVCGDSRILNLMQIIGYIINVIKILVPLILIVLGMVEFGKAAISNDDKALSKAASSLIRRFVAGIIIFFIPTIVFALLNTTGVSDENDTEGNFIQCTKCMLKPGSECTATSAVSGDS